MWNAVMRQAVRAGSRRSLRVAAMAAAVPSACAAPARSAVPAAFVSVRMFAKKRSKAAPPSNATAKTAASSAAPEAASGEGGDAAGFQAIVDKAKRNMEGGVLQFERALGQMRPGRADPNVLDEVRVAAYGQHVALSQLAQVAVAGPYALSITIFDPVVVPDIKEAIVSAFPVFGIREDASTLHISIPNIMSRETREELLKAAKKLAETSRQHVRRARQDAATSVKKLKSQVSEDDVKRELEHIQDLTDDAITRIGTLLAAKETELKEGM